MRKVLAILAKVPCGRDAGEIGRIALWLRGLAPELRAELAARAGVRAPSETTWAEVVKAAEQRVAIADAFRGAA